MAFYDAHKGAVWGLRWVLTPAPDRAGPWDRARCAARGRCCPGTSTGNGRAAGRSGPAPAATGPASATTRPTTVGPGQGQPIHCHDRRIPVQDQPIPRTAGPSSVPAPVPAAPPRGAAVRGDFRGCGGRREAARAGRGAGMAAMSSLEAVRRKIRSLQEQADAAEERAGRLQREVDQERALREEVGPPFGPAGGRGLGARVSVRGCPVCLRWRSGRPLPSPPCPTRWMLPAELAVGSARSAAFRGSVTRVLRGPGPGEVRRETALGVLANSKTPSCKEVGLRRDV